MCQAAHGTTDFLTEDTLAAQLCFVGDDPVEKVVISLLRWQFADDIAGVDEYKILGISNACPEPVVSVHADRPHRVRRGARAGRHGGDGDGDAFDLLEDMFDDHHVLQRCAEQQARVGQGPGVSVQPLHDGLLEIVAEEDPLAMMLLEIVGDPLQPSPVEEEEDEEEREGEAGQDEQEEELEDDLAEGEVLQASADNMELGEVAAPPVDERAAFIVGLPIYDRGNWKWHDKLTHAAVGNINRLGPWSLKATCKLHAGCACAISIPTPGSQRARDIEFDVTFLAIERDLLAWFVSGMQASRQQHAQSALELRAHRYHMRLRG